MALRTQTSLLEVLKNEFGEVDETMFQGVERPYEPNFSILVIEKSDLDGFVYVIIQVGKWPQEHIICLLDI
jgi:hypothetical protein